MDVDGVRAELLNPPIGEKKEKRMVTVGGDGGRGKNEIFFCAQHRRLRSSDSTDLMLNDCTNCSDWTLCGRAAT